MQLKALLLDLDGTLVDTAPDMVATLNRVLVQNRQAPIEYAVASKVVSNGARALLELGYGKALSNDEAQPLVQQFLHDYADNVSNNSIVYDGMDDVLTLCTDNNIRWGVVTNKPLALARSLLSDLQLLDECSILLGGDSLPVKKPDPAPLLHCCMVMHLAGSECLYIGDHLRDIQAGNSAGMDTGAALWGYISDDEDVGSWDANFHFQKPFGLRTLIEQKILFR